MTQSRSGAGSCERRGSARARRPASSAPHPSQASAPEALLRFLHGPMIARSIAAYTSIRTNLVDWLSEEATKIPLLSKAEEMYQHPLGEVLL